LHGVTEQPEVRSGEQTSEYFSGEPYPEGDTEIYVLKASDPSSQKRLTKNASLDNVPAWSPNGKKIAFMSSRKANFDIYALSINTREQKRLTTNSALDYMPDWQPLVN
jgi:Tol biopolymer transport system component